jgi:hypothetical protein
MCLTAANRYVDHFRRHDTTGSCVFHGACGLNESVSSMQQSSSDACLEDEMPCIPMAKVATKDQRNGSAYV